MLFSVFARVCGTDKEHVYVCGGVDIVYVISIDTDVPCRLCICQATEPQLFTRSLTHTQTHTENENHL